MAVNKSSHIVTIPDAKPARPRDHKGRLTAYGQLEPMQRAFVRHILAGRDDLQAAELAGFANPATMAASWRAHKGIMTAVQDGLATTAGQVTALALVKLLAILRSGTLDKDHRQLMAVLKTVQDKAVPAAQRPEAPKEGDNSTLDDLYAALQEVERQRGADARPIDLSSVADVPHLESAPDLDAD